MPRIQALRSEHHLDHGLGVLLACGVLCGVLSACGGGASDDRTADPSPSAPSSTAGPTGSGSSPSTTISSGSTPGSPSTSSASDTPALCSAVPDQALTRLAGRPTTFYNSDQSNGATECEAVSQDNSVAAIWESRGDAGSLDVEVRMAQPQGLRRTATTVADHPAALLVGAPTGQRVAKVVVVVAGQSLSVNATYLVGVGPSVSLRALKSLALGVAEKAAPTLG